MQNRTSDEIEETLEEAFGPNGNMGAERLADHHRIMRRLDELQDLNNAANVGYFRPRTGM